MPLHRIGLVAALASSGVALLLLAAAPLGWRLGWWHYRLGLYWMIPASGMIAAGGAILSVLTLALTWPQLRARGVAMLSAALVLGAILAFVPWQYSQIRRTVPPIHDITTDTGNPPAFSAVLEARAAELANSVDDRSPQLAELQRAAYPDLAPVTAAMPVAQAFDAAVATARSMPGWRIVATDAAAGRIEASQQSRWFGFTDDVVIRVVGDEAGSRIDVRSTSRQGRSDYGVNAVRIRAYTAALRKRIG